MKSIFLRLLLVILVFIGIIWAIGCFIPRDYSIQSTIEIAAPSEDVFSMINELPNWQDWSPWGTEGINVKYSGESAGKGSIQTWADPRGDGKLWITESQPTERVAYQMVVAGFPEMSGNFLIEPKGESSRVTWSSEGTLPSGAFYGYFSFLFGPAMKARYDFGLGKLKENLEGS